MQMRFNPFNPQGLIAPGMFCGRQEELAAIERCLAQTRHGNPQHFLFHGERGIGKSSLLLYVEALAHDEDVAGQEYNFLCVPVDLANCATQLDILRAIGTGFKDALNLRSKLKARCGKFWDWLTNWEILGVRYHKHPEEYDAQEAALELVGNLATLCENAAKDLDGILLLIDEADRPDERAGLGALLKLLTERLARRKCNRVAIVMAGLPSTLGRLRDSHASSPRLFRTMLVERLEPAHAKQVVRAGLAIAKKHNGDETTIEDGALDLIADLSEGYPHFIQQFAFSAFEADEDDNIDARDVLKGATDALTQLGDHYFSDMYHARAMSADYRKVLDAMAKHGDKWVSRKTIISESKVKETSVTNALAALKKRGVIIPDDTRSGFYKLPTLSFAVWINAFKTAKPTRGKVSDLFGK